MSISLENKVIIVSGASKRLGRCYAMALGKAGATVIALARTMGNDPKQVGTLFELETTGQAAGYDIHAYPCDLSSEKDIEIVVSDVADRHGGIDGLINNAVYASDRRDPLAISTDVWEEAMRVNVRAPYLLISRCYPHMVARGGGSIINVTSLAAQATGRGGGAHKGLVLYGASKAALNRLTTWFAAEFESDNIAVNAISPGDVSVFMQITNGVAARALTNTIVEGNQLDEEFWGNPVAYLSQVRPAEMTGQTLHTYTYGESWGLPYGPEHSWSPEILRILGRDNISARG